PPSWRSTAGYFNTPESSANKPSQKPKKVPPGLYFNAVGDCPPNTGNRPVRAGWVPPAQRASFMDGEQIGVAHENPAPVFLLAQDRQSIARTPQHRLAALRCDGDRQPIAHIGAISHH